ncbi:MAG TPA: DUF1579 family protein [Kofleriaceae bacterium]|jgi:hypothetical protein|nr:DUF1579 family protein [Kofleriaceae bacterium]
MGAEDITDTNEVSHAALATAVLADDVGTWDADLEITPSPRAETHYQKGYRTSAMVGERWLVSDVRMYSGFAGHGIYGWDANAQRYTAVWVDTVSGAIAHAVGRFEHDTRTMTYDFEVAHAGKTVRYRETFVTVDKDTQLYTHHIALPGGGEHEMMRITYKRRAAT